jgi:hypothetical protein
MTPASTRSTPKALTDGSPLGNRLDDRLDDRLSKQLHDIEV